MGVEEKVWDWREIIPGQYYSVSQPAQQSYFSLPKYGSLPDMKALPQLAAATILPEETMGAGLLGFYNTWTGFIGINSEVFRSEKYAAGPAEVWIHENMHRVDPSLSEYVVRVRAREMSSPESSRYQA